MVCLNPAPPQHTVNSVSLLRWVALMSPLCFRNKNSRNILTVFPLGTLADGKFKKTRLHFMKVSDDLFCVLSPGTYFEVLSPYKVIKFIQSFTSKAT